MRQSDSPRWDGCAVFGKVCKSREERRISVLEVGAGKSRRGQGAGESSSAGHEDAKGLGRIRSEWEGSMADIFHDLAIQAPLGQVDEAVSTPGGLEWVDGQVGWGAGRGSRVGALV